MITRIRRFTLKQKIIGVMLLTSGIVLLLASVALVLREGISFWKEGKEKLTVFAEVIGSNVAAPILFDDRQAAGETLTGLSANPHILAAYVLSNDGRVFAEYHKFDDQTATSLITPETIIRDAGSQSFWDLDSCHAVVVPITSDGQVIGRVLIRSDRGELSSRLKWFVYIFSVIALVVLLIAYYISLKLQGIISSPILELAGTMEKISEERNYSVRARKVNDDEIGRLIDGFNEMLAQIEKRDERLDYLAHFDSLTLLPNRVTFQDRLAQALHLASRADQQLAVLFIDLDGFKDINDTHGHRLGDLLLQEVAGHLLRHVRQSDTVARLGGDEFVIFLQNCGDVVNVAGVAEQFMQCFAKPFQLDGIEIFISASIGISMFPDDGKEIEELVKNSDAAMYHAKKKGKNGFYFFSEHMHQEASKRLCMANGLRRALEKQQFILHYQPKVDLASGNIIGTEALMRWNHPEHGILLPAQFIPLAEENGLIIPIGEWVLATVCRQIREWLEMGLRAFPVAVNVSACQFRSQNFEATVAGILQETGIDPAYLELELTESAVMHDVEGAMLTLSALKSMGIHISIDDFGTGYSSLAYLKRFTIDRIKIDRSFVSNIPHSRDDNTIVIAIIAIARSLNLKVIAEGVETEEQLSFLERQGCHEIQGYLCSRPLHPALLVPFFFEHNWRKVPEVSHVPARPCYELFLDAT